MTQADLVIKYCEENGSIIPAKLVQRAYKGEWFGSEISRVCRGLRAKGVLISEKDGRFEKFYLVKANKPSTTLKESDYCKECNWFLNHSPACSKSGVKKVLKRLF